MNTSKLSGFAIGAAATIVCGIIGNLAAGFFTSDPLWLVFSTAVGMALCLAFGRTTAEFSIKAMWNRRRNQSRDEFLDYFVGGSFITAMLGSLLLLGALNINSASAGQLAIPKPY
jgi:uncharacterized membrane protein YeaQ/YmgE (transglycosylase-associated protein family)